MIIDKKNTRSFLYFNAILFRNNIFIYSSPDLHLHPLAAFFNLFKPISIISFVLLFTLPRFAAQSFAQI